MQAKVMTTNQRLWLDHVKAADDTDGSIDSTVLTTKPGAHLREINDFFL